MALTLDFRARLNFSPGLPFIEAIMANRLEVKHLAALGLLATLTACGLEPSYDFGPNMAFTATDLDFESTARATADRWNKAGKLGLRVGAGGVPINLLEQARDHEGNAVCATTRLQADLFGNVTGVIRIDITRADPGCAPPADLLLHELLHAFAPDAEHTGSGVFRGAIEAAPQCIDDPSLVEACSWVTCKGFEVEC